MCVSAFQSMEPDVDKRCSDSQERREAEGIAPHNRDSMLLEEFPDLGGVPGRMTEFHCMLYLRRESLEERAEPYQIAGVAWWELPQNWASSCPESSDSLYQPGEVG